jgi:hypothetical protein
MATSQLALSPELDPDEPVTYRHSEVQGGADDVRIDHDYTTPSNRTGTPMASGAAVGAALIEEFEAKHLCNTERERGAQPGTNPNSVTIWELYTDLYPHGPGVQDFCQTRLEYDVASALISQLSRLSSPGLKTHLQSGVKHLDALVCEGKVGRKLVYEGSAKKVSVTMSGRFITQDGSLMVKYNGLAAAKAMAAEIRKGGNIFGLIGERNPDARLPLANVVWPIITSAMEGVEAIADPRNLRKAINQAKAAAPEPTFQFGDDDTEEGDG